MDAVNQEILDRVEGLKKRRFWGKLTICFQKGDIYHYIIEENIKPKNGGNNEHGIKG